jgi:GntR family transcriptional repressor for pyruvate dehydrogenase complex
VRPRIGATVLSADASGAVDALALGALLGDGALDDLYEFRQILEVEIAGRAATRAGAPELTEIGLALDSYRDALARDLPTFKRDIAFHQALAHASGNRVYADVLKALSGMLVEARARTQAVPGAPQRAMEEHQAIYAAIMAGDENGARAAMARHIESAKWALEESRRRQAEVDAAEEASATPATDGDDAALVGQHA